MSIHARLLTTLVGLVASSVIAGCGGTDSPPDQGEEDDAALFSGTPNEDIGQFFMIEHYGVVPAGYPDVTDMIKKKNLGSIILWNPTQASGETNAQMVTRYAEASRDSNHAELFVAADQEERGTQRFKSRNGFTDLAEGAALGRAVAKHQDARVCELHGRITAREMAAAGMNMSLGTVSDIFTRNSGTPGMFRTRAIDAKPELVASCVDAMMKGYAAEGHVVFVTKHFPGLGNASGNTDVDPSVRSYSDTAQKMEQELLPYRGTIASVNESGSSALFGAMISHASYKVLDATETPATLSSAILTDFVRGAATQDFRAGVEASGQPATFKGMELKGLTVSDAYWTWGATKNLTPIAKRRLMARAFIAGMDVLMIAKADFVGAWDYFQAAMADALPPDEASTLVRETGARDWAELSTKFKARVAESAARVKTSKTKVGAASSMIRRGEPRATTTDLTADYLRLLQ